MFAVVPSAPACNSSSKLTVGHVGAAFLFPADVQQYCHEGTREEHTAVEFHGTDYSTMPAT